MFRSKRLAATALALTTLLMAQLASTSALAKKSPSKTPTPAREQFVTKSPAFVKATQNYKQGKYLEASKQFEYIDSHGGCCQWTHYYLGLCYQGQNQVGLAFRHFQWVLTNGRDANLRHYSQYASDTLTYYAANRTYEGHGGIVAAVAASQHGGGGGGGSFG